MIHYVCVLYAKMYIHKLIICISGTNISVSLLLSCYVMYMFCWHLANFNAFLFLPCNFHLALHYFCDIHTVCAKMYVMLNVSFVRALSNVFLISNMVHWLYMLHFFIAIPHSFAFYCTSFQISCVCWHLKLMPMQISYFLALAIANANMYKCV